MAHLRDNSTGFIVGIGDQPAVESRVTPPGAFQDIEGAEGGKEWISDNDSTAGRAQNLASGSTIQRKIDGPDFHQSGQEITQEFSNPGVTLQDNDSVNSL